MFDIVLFQPEIPPNTGNVIRLSANCGARLHLVKPLGFEISDRTLARAGLDYHDLTHVSIHEDWQSCLIALAGRRILAFSTRGRRRYDQVRYRHGDVLLFGRETSGLPDEVLAALPPDQRLRIPMRPANRSINLSNAVALAAYEAWRQHDFAGALEPC
ncbi:MAG TPA: tRNA (cytidine(34)-2'-O)-methyltransferase [Pseudothauera hydrothermalis]|jgi:tRNA (cytidine/uridine-2'-O-)-methyltransferase|uniref:tRNA (cytidine(34)-2'-O)-methyltransferase n=1 Tax=Pseudothauera hydrothermalis TaxID=2184083 RepID=UPI000C7E4692|nr:tRNA (cytidine(34)-2'-O)-methyltransferase [Pseudothauera hydrothermalis]AUL99396.1 tRNA (uridine(34)/cytosine(34)/5-carboxymethylaminomethyluridine(34)-2'-O)-methyltransferase TrmL [Rhodocyclaceae bacterium]AVZ78632.1 tRNA (cytidine(34)-2'-O)-methyltransferase [Zoogloeaceae bacteirum Par-f-2]HNQ76243.1 tRNA (cytidine(34)-2'-O)-methyltransferase [Pseudothauera hydrothermalis]